MESELYPSFRIEEINMCDELIRLGVEKDLCKKIYKAYKYNTIGLKFNKIGFRNELIKIGVNNTTLDKIVNFLGANFEQHIPNNIEISEKIYNKIENLDMNDLSLGQVYQMTSPLGSSGYLIVDKDLKLIKISNCIPLQITKHIKDALNFYMGRYAYANFLRGNKPFDMHIDSIPRRIEIGVDDAWVINKYGSNLPKNVYFVFVLINYKYEFEKTVFMLKEEKYIDEIDCTCIENYVIKRNLSKEEIINTAYFLKHGPLCNFLKVNVEFRRDMDTIVLNHLDPLTRIDLPEGWCMGQLYFTKNKNKIVGEIEYFGSKEQSDIINIIEDYYTDANKLDIEKSNLIDSISRYYAIIIYQLETSDHIGYCDMYDNEYDKYQLYEYAELFKHDFKEYETVEIYDYEYYSKFIPEPEINLDFEDTDSCAISEESEKHGLGQHQFRITVNDIKLVDKSEIGILY